VHLTKLCTASHRIRGLNNMAIMNISCQEVRKELANYMEDDVSAELRFRIERHFLSCDGCNAIYDGLRNVIRLVGSTEIIELPEGFSRRLYERIAAAS
jgi:Putative zinc-finger